jgi:transcriptional regulator with XRE-family HTH domain
MISIALQSNLKTIRKQRGLTLQQLADAVNRTKQAVAYLEKNGTNPRIDTAYAIAEALGVSVTEIWICKREAA